MPYIFCLTVDVVAVLCIAWLGWLILHGASCWPVSVMLLISLGLILPGRDIFTCPKCGHIAEVKVYKARNNITLGVQKDKNDPDD